MAADVESEIFVDDSLGESANLLIAVEHDRRHAAARQIVRGGEPSGAGADDDDGALRGGCGHRGRICQMRVLPYIAAAIFSAGAAAAQVDLQASLF